MEKPIPYFVITTPGLTRKQIGLFMTDRALRTQMDNIKESLLKECPADMRVLASANSIVMDNPTDALDKRRKAFVVETHFTDDHNAPYEPLAFAGL